MTLGML